MLSARHLQPVVVFPPFSDMNLEVVYKTPWTAYTPKALLTFASLGFKLHLHSAKWARWGKERFHVPYLMISARLAFQTTVVNTPKDFEQRRILNKSNPLVNRLLFLHHTIFPNPFLVYTENKNKNTYSINLGNFLEVNFNLTQTCV